jgi:hypothetical protein
MGGLFSKPKMPDTSKQEAVMAAQEERIQQQERDKTQQLMARRRAVGRGGMAALLSPERTNAEQGLGTTLGGGTNM